MHKLSVRIADQIGRNIAEAGWPVGRIVATEAALIRHFDASRAIVREALGLVELRGIATMKAGKGGGLMVSAPAREAVVMELATYLQLADMRLEDVMETWHLLQAKAVELAIMHIDEGDAAILAGFDQRLRGPAGVVADEMTLFRGLWSVLADMARNPILAMFIAGFQNAMSGLTMARLHQPDQVAHHLDQSRTFKRAMLKGILSCDLFSAHSALRSDFLNQYHSMQRSQIGSMSRIDQRSERGDGKLPRWIALLISRQIADHGLKPGDPLGSEAELLARFQVSRSVLREAIRMLEAYSVVAMRRGHGGGLRVSTPDPASTCDTVVRFMNTQPMTLEHSFQIRSALEIRSAGMAAKRATADDIVSIEARLRNMEESGGQPSTTDLVKVASMLAEASANKPLAFIIGITLQHLGGNDGVPPGTDLRLVASSYSRMIGAVRAGDAAQARRLMHDHLRMIRRIERI